MRLVYLLLGCLTLGFCSMAHRLPDSAVNAEEPTVEVVDDLKPLTPEEFEKFKADLDAKAKAVEGKRPKPDRPKPRPRPKPDRHDDDVVPAPAPIPPRPKPEPDPNFNRVRPLPPLVIPVPDIKPVKPGFLVWLLTGAATLVKWLVVGLVAIVIVAVVVFRRWLNPFA